MPEFIAVIHGCGAGCRTGYAAKHSPPTIGCNVRVVSLVGATTAEEASDLAFAEYEKLFRGPLGAKEIVIHQIESTFRPDMDAFQAKAETNLRADQERERIRNEQIKKKQGPTLAYAQMRDLCDPDNGVITVDGMVYSRVGQSRWEMHDSFGEDFRQQVLFQDTTGRKFALHRKSCGIPQGYLDLDRNDGKTVLVK